MKRLYLDGREVFGRGYASRLLKEADARLFGPHGQPRGSASVAGKEPADAEAAQPSAAQNTQAEANSARSCVRRRKKLADPKQMRFDV